MIDAFNISNSSEIAVLDSTFFSYYNGRKVLRLRSEDFTSCGLSDSIILLNTSEIYDAAAKPADNNDAILTVKHEYGHTVQAEELGMITYYTTVYIDSVSYWLVEVATDDHTTVGGWISDNYYNMPWERSADAFGGIDAKNERPDYQSWSDGVADAYIELCKLSKYLNES